MKNVLLSIGLSALFVAAAFVGCSTDKGGGSSGGDDDGNSGGAGGAGGAGQGAAGPAGSQASTGMMTTSATTTAAGGAGPGSGGAGTGGGTPAACNPVTNQGCDAAAGEACDANNMAGFECFAPPNDVPLCGACSNANGPFCAPGSTCQGEMATKCVRYCCTDADCGTSFCTTGGFIQQGQVDLGVCDTMMGCLAPPIAPSGGSCVN